MCEKRPFALSLLALLLVFCCVTGAARASAPDRSVVLHAPELQQHLELLVQRARPGILGVAVLDLASGRMWGVNAKHAFPMMSVFKAPVAAAVLARIDHGELSWDQAVIVERSDLESGTIRDHFKGVQMSFSVRQLLVDAVSKSDNTAVDALLKLIGGPRIVTSFLRAHGIEGMRVDLGERGFMPVFEDLPPGRNAPANETPKQELARLRRGYHAYLIDPRNRSTPEAGVKFLRKLWTGKLLSPASTRYLIDLMYAQTVPSRLRRGLPAGVRLADKCGTSYSLENVTAAFNDIGILTWPDGHAVIVAAFLTASTASQNQRNTLFADLAYQVAGDLHP